MATRTRGDGSPTARAITALLREARELRGGEDQGRREAYLARKEQLLAGLAEGGTS